jgi:DNA-binding PadR family transcriptional regulator
LTDGNLHVQTHKLAAVGYIEITNALQGRRSVTEFRITRLGLEQFQLHVAKLQRVLKSDTGHSRVARPAKRRDDSQVWS